MEAYTTPEGDHQQPATGCPHRQLLVVKPARAAIPTPKKDNYYSGLSKAQLLNPTTPAGHNQQSTRAAKKEKNPSASNLGYGQTRAENQSCYIAVAQLLMISTPRVLRSPLPQLRSSALRQFKIAVVITRSKELCRALYLRTHIALYLHHD